jgi:hypothetical protein
MPTFRVTAPDGKTYDVTGPEGSTAEQALARVKATVQVSRPAAVGGPNDPLSAENINPAKNMSGVERFAAGAGKAVSDVGLGVQQVGARVADFVAPRERNLSSLVTGNAPQSRVEELQAKVAESRRLDAPLMQTGAGVAGNIAGNVAMLAPTTMIPGVNTVTGAATVGGLAGALQPATSAGETALNTGLGVAGGAAGQWGANKLAQLATSAGSSITQGQRAAAAGGQAQGMRLTPGKASGSTTLQKFEAAAESNPLTSAGFDSIKEGNQKALNRAAAKAIGENADELSTPILARAEQRIGAVFNSVADTTPVPLDPQQVGARLTRALQDSEGLIGGNASLSANPLFQRFDEFVNSAGGATREQLRALSSKLGKAARNNMTGDRELGQALFGLQEIAEDAIEGSLSAAQRAAYSEARGQYRNLMTLTAKTNVTNPSSGNVSGRSLATTLMQKDRGGFTMGGKSNDLYDAARFTQAFPDIVGNSGTATRSMGPADYLTGLPGNVLMRLYLSQPVTAAAGAGAGAAGTAARLANNPLTRLTAAPAGTTAGVTLADLLKQ